MEKFRDFLAKYKGAIIGAVLALIAIFLRIHEILIGCIIVVAGALFGNYVQQNKEKVKDTIRRVVDKW